LRYVVDLLQHLKTQKHAAIFSRLPDCQNVRVFRGFELDGRPSLGVACVPATVFGALLAILSGTSEVALHEGR
jgi:hypothetical protein